MEIGRVQSASPALGLYSVQSSNLLNTAFYDPKDSNRDGVVTYSEAQAYARKHPAAAAIDRPRIAEPILPKATTAQPPRSFLPYGPGGLLNPGLKAVSQNLDLFA